MTKPFTTFRSLILPFCLLAAPASLFAQTATGDDIVVTALRTPVDHDRVASSVTVLDLADIQAAQPLALADLLVRTPGVSLSQTGGYGSTTELRIRGANPEDTMLVIDGMRIADPTSPAGNLDYSQFFTDDVARIELLRGPQSILWGSDAMAGVVSVTTATPTAPLQASFSVEGGSHKMLNAHAGIGGTSALVDWRISGSDFTTAGIPSIIGSTVPNGYDRQAASVTTTFHIAQNVSLDLRGLWDQGRNGYSDAYANFYDAYQLNKQWAAYAGLNFTLLDGHFKNRLSASQDRTDIQDFDASQIAYAGTALQQVGHGRTRRYEYQGGLNLAKNVDLVFGAEREEQRMLTGTPYDIINPFELIPHTAATNSVYGEARVSPVTGLTLNGGVRYDHHSQFGGNTVFSAGGAYTPDGGATLLRASYDQGFKAPSLYQLYSDYGTAALAPEHSKGWEVGAERSLFAKALHIAATWYERDSTSLIQYYSCPYSGTLPAACYVPGTTDPRYGYYANIGAAKAHGAELAANLRLGHLFADANYSYTVSQDRTPGSATYGQQLLRVPRNTANGDLGYDWAHGVTTSVALRYSGGAPDLDFNSYPTANVTLPSYALVDLRASWAVLPALTLYGRVDNIGNQQHQTSLGYNSLGRAAYIGLRSRF